MNAIAFCLNSHARRVGRAEGARSAEVGRVREGAGRGRGVRAAGVHRPADRRREARERLDFELRMRREGVGEAVGGVCRGKVDHAGGSRRRADSARDPRTFQGDRGEAIEAMRSRQGDLGQAIAARRRRLGASGTPRLRSKRRARSDAFPTPVRAGSGSTGASQPGTRSVPRAPRVAGSVAGSPSGLKG